MKNIQQFYDEKRVMNIAGRKATLQNVDPEKVLNAEYDMSIVESQTTPAYREWANEWLMELWRAGAIGVEHLLEYGNFPFGDALLQGLRSQQEQMQQGGMAQGLAPELQQQIQQQAPANQQAVNQLYGAMRPAA